MNIIIPKLICSHATSHDLLQITWIKMSAVITYGEYKACVGSGDVLGVSDPRLAAVSYFRPSSYSFSSFMYQVAQNNVCLFPSQRSGRASGVESAPRPSPRPTTGKTPSPWRLHLS